jgi:hypothetical protein
LCIDASVAVDLDLYASPHFRFEPWKHDPHRIHSWRQKRDTVQARFIRNCVSRLLRRIVRYGYFDAREDRPGRIGNPTVDRSRNPLANRCAAQCPH